jgi:hypothetical protein
LENYIANVEKIDESTKLSPLLIDPIVVNTKDLDKGKDIPFKQPSSLVEAICMHAGMMPPT